MKFDYVFARAFEHGRPRHLMNRLIVRSIMSSTLSVQ